MAVGPGMLDAARPGNVFAAPPMEYVLECTRLMNSKKGVLHLINNYTGDRAAWEMAREMAEAEDLKIGVVLIKRRCGCYGYCLHGRPAWSCG
jgi:phosphoenolpyruvate---glycerone phosphotransferase subunit DhaK